MKRLSFVKIIFIGVIAVLIPVLSNTTYQIVQQNKDEDLIQSIYEQQLASILFSINERCWGLFHRWPENIRKSIAPYSRPVSNRRIRIEMQDFINQSEYILAAYIKIPRRSANLVRSDLFYSQMNNIQIIEKVEEMVESRKDEVNKIIARAKIGYIQPLAVSWEFDETTMRTLLIFPVIYNENAKLSLLAGVLIDNKAFVDEIVAIEFEDIKEGRFEFAVAQADESILYSTEEDETDIKFEKSEKLWILPNLNLLIKLKGTTLAELSKKRVRTNMSFLIVMNLFFVAGLFILVKSIFSEMKLSRLRTEFVNNVSHELRTPLALIKMHIELLRMGAVADEKKRDYYYKLIESESDRLTQIVNNILDFSKIETMKKEYNLQSNDLLLLVQEALARYQYHLERNNFEVQTHLPNKISILNFDKDAITQAFMNLLDNAVKYSQEIKKIVITLAENDEYVSLSVQDLGIGIPEMEQDKIFDKFYRVNNDVTQHVRGSGLGLSLVRHIMNLHNGEIAIKSKKGKGSTFTLLFPKGLDNFVDKKI